MPALSPSRVHQPHCLRVCHLLSPTAIKTSAITAQSGATNLPQACTTSTGSMEGEFLSDILCQGNDLNGSEPPFIVPEQQEEIEIEVPHMSVRTTTKRSKNFTKDEDKMLISAWLNISMDPIQGNEQPHDTYWERIHAYFYEYKRFDSNRNQNSRVIYKRMSTSLQLVWVM